jgi:aspartyl aminopeptidase
LSPSINVKYTESYLMSMEKDKTAGQKLEEKLMVKPKNLGEIDGSMLKEAQKFCEGYKEFLGNKTEREVVDYALPILQKNGYKEYELGKKYAPGEKVYLNNRGKNLIMVTVGKKSPAEGLRIAVAHIDSPRLDFKPSPMYEDTELAYFKTHYYGGIKKYQWTTIPLSLHGVVSLADGTSVKVRIGEDPEDPVLCITDLLPHLARDQMQKPAPKIVEGEQLNVLIGCWPYKDEKVSSKVKLNIMNLLAEKYSITEKDFLSAELCAVPAFKPTDMGLDRSMVGGYGQDDSVCAYAEFMAELKTKKPEYTTVTVFIDKEETGSDGVTGMRSFMFKDFIEDFVSAYGAEVRHVLRRSMCLSCDVNAAVDPNWPEVFEKKNCSFLNYGPVISKYTGSGGKYSTNDASAETMGYLRRILEEAKVPWQVGELGKIDAGGGGTIASEISIHNIDTVDMGVPLLSMHSPFEVTAKADTYMLYKAVYAFFNSKLVKP